MTRIGGLAALALLAVASSGAAHESWHKDVETLGKEGRASAAGRLERFAVGLHTALAERVPYIVADSLRESFRVL